MVLKCHLCKEEKAQRLTFSTTDYLKHIQLFHAHQPNFLITCGIEGCQRTFQNFHTFRKHISDWHRSDPNPTNHELDCSLEVNTTDLFNSSSYTIVGNETNQATVSSDHSDVQTTLATLQTSSALLLMSLKEERKLTQTSLQGVVEGVTSLNQIRLSALHSEVCKALNAAGLSSSVPGLDEIFNCDGPFGRPFLGLETQHQQQSFYKEHFQFIVSTF